MTTRADLDDPKEDRLVSLLASRPRGAIGRKLAHYLGVSQPTFSMNRSQLDGELKALLGCATKDGCLSSTAQG